METSENSDNLKPASDWISYYRINATKAHQLKQANDHAGAKQIFAEILERIQELKDAGVESEWIDMITSTLHYEISDCLISLQATPSEVNKNFHHYGEFLKEQIIRFASLDHRLAELADFFDEDFSITDMQSLQQLMVRFESAILITKGDQLTEEEKLSLGMIYLFLNKFFEAAFLFFGFSTKMVAECYECSAFFRTTAERTKQYFDSLDADFLEKKKFGKYKKYVNKWFGIYSHIIGAKFALYVRNHVDDTNWAFSQDETDMLWKDIDDYLNVETDDDAIHTMKLLLEIYEINALTSVSNYEDSMKNFDKILKQAERLEHPERIIFCNHLKRAIIARKYLMDIDYDRASFTKQIQHTLQGHTAELEDTLEDNSSFADLGFFEELDEDKITNALPDVHRKHVAALSDESKQTVYEAVKSWEDKLTKDYKQALKFAKLYSSAEVENEDHINRKWLAILQARAMLTDYHAEKFKQEESTKEKKESYDDLTQSLLAAIEETNSDADEIDRLNIKLNQIEALLLKCADKPKVAYFRQLAEIYVLLGKVHVEKIELMIDKVTEGDDINVDEEPYVCFDKARDYLCSAYNLLQDLEQDQETVRNTALHNELSIAYSRLKFINYSKSESKRIESTIVHSIKNEANDFRKKKWIKSFCNVLRSDELADLEHYKAFLLFGFEREAVKLSSNIHSLTIIDSGLDLPQDLDFRNNVAVQNNVAKNGMYKTYIGIFGVGDFFLCLETELPLSPETLKILSLLAEKILKLFIIHGQRTELSQTDDENEKNHLKIEILKNTYELANELLPNYIVEDKKRMHERFFSKLIDAYNEENPDQIDPEYAKYIALIYDIGMAGIDSSFLNKPTGLLPYEKIKLKQHIAAGLEILRGVIGTDEFIDVFMASMLHHYRESGNGYPEELADLRRPDSPQHLMIFLDNLTVEELGAIYSKGELSHKEKFLIKALAICDTLKAITADREHRDKIIENDEQVQMFLQNQAVDDFPVDFIEFVKSAVYSDDGISFIWE